MKYAVAKCYNPGSMARTEGHRLLEESGRTQAEIVRGIGRKAPTVYRWFNGGRPDIDSMQALRVFLGIPLEAWTRPPGNRKRKAS